MDRNTCGRLCQLLRHIGGLKDDKYVIVEEQVAIFLGILAHPIKRIGLLNLIFGDQDRQYLTMYIVF